MKDYRKHNSKILIKANSIGLFNNIKLADTINKVNINIPHLDLFIDNMKEIGYNQISKSFLTKVIGDIEINITIRNSNIETIIGYQNNESIEIDNDLLQSVITEIQNSL